MSRLTRVLERRGEARDPETLVFAQLPPLFNVNLCKALPIPSYVGREALDSSEGKIGKINRKNQQENERDIYDVCRRNRVLIIMAKAEFIPVHGQIGIRSPSCLSDHQAAVMLLCF